MNTPQPHRAPLVLFLRENRYLPTGPVPRTSLTADDHSVRGLINRLARESRKYQVKHLTTTHAAEHTEGATPAVHPVGALLDPAIDEIRIAPSSKPMQRSTTELSKSLAYQARRHPINLTCAANPTSTATATGTNTTSLRRPR